MQYHPGAKSVAFFLYRRAAKWRSLQKIISRRSRNERVHQCCWDRETLFGAQARKQEYDNWLWLSRRSMLREQRALLFFLGLMVYSHGGEGTRTRPWSHVGFNRRNTSLNTHRHQAQRVSSRSCTFRHTTSSTPLLLSFFLCRCKTASEVRPRQSRPPKTSGSFYCWWSRTTGCNWTAGGAAP